MWSVLDGVVARRERKVRRFWSQQRIRRRRRKWKSVVSRSWTMWALPKKDLRLHERDLTKSVMIQRWVPQRRSMRDYGARGQT